MLAALLALFAAVAVTLVYLVLTEEMDYASVRRRQLDAWAAIAAVACLGVILYGNASGRQRLEHPTGPVQGPIPQLTESSPSLAATPMEPVKEPAAETEAVSVLAEGPATMPEAPVPPFNEERAEPGFGSPAETGHEEAASSDRDGKPPPPLPEFGNAEATKPTVPTGTPPAPATATEGRPELPDAPGVVRSTPTRAVTDVPSPEPTRVVYATTTPHCGDPDDIDVRVGTLTSSIERRGRDVIVNFGFDVRNASDFPVTLKSMAVALQAGTDTFGSTSLGVVTIEPGAMYPVADRILIQRFPAPNERVEMCVMYVPESCGRSPVIRGYQCWNNIPSFLLEPIPEPDL